MQDNDNIRNTMQNVLSKEKIRYRFQKKQGMRYENGSYMLRKRFRHKELKSVRHFQYDFPWRKNIYNGEDGTIFGRTPLVWFQFTLALAVFMVFITILSLALFEHFYNGLNYYVPSVKKTMPSISFAPMGDYPHLNTIAWNPNNNTQVMEIDRKIRIFLDKYGQWEYLSDFASTLLIPHFGYKNGFISFFIKLNRIIGFETEPFETVDDVDDDSLPIKLKKYLNQTDKHIPSRGKIYFLCEDVAQRQHTGLSLYPQHYVPVQYFDMPKCFYRPHAKGYQKFYDFTDFKRIIGIQINLNPQPQLTLQCSFWAKNFILRSENRNPVSETIILHMLEPPANLKLNKSRRIQISEGYYYNYSAQYEQYLQLFGTEDDLDDGFAQQN